MPNVQAPHLQSLASGLPAEISSQLFAAFGAHDKYARDIAQALNLALVVGDTLQVFRPYTQAAPLTIDATQALNFAKYNTTAGQVLTKSAWTIINFATAVTSNTNVTTGAAWKFTAPRAADYLFHAAVETDNAAAAATEYQASFWKNGAQEAKVATLNSYATAANYLTLHGGVTLRLAASDYVDFRVIHNNAADTNVTATAAENWIDVRELMDDAARVSTVFPFDVLWPKQYPPTMVVAQCADANQTSPSAFALQLPDWTTSTKGGQTMIKVKNIPGLIAGRSYSVTLVVF